MKFISSHQTHAITREQELELFRRIRQGDRRALNALILANYRFVLQVANFYRRRTLMPFEDLIAEGMWGLYRASQSFKPEDGNKFISYAVWWIRQAILFAVTEQSTPVHVPYNIHMKASRKKPATPREAQETLEAKEILRNVRSSSAMEALVESGFQFQTDEPSPEDTMEGAFDRKLVEEMLAGLGSREEEILRSRFGIDSDNCETLEQIAGRMEITRERVRQIENKAMAILKKRHAKQRDRIF